MFFWINCSDEEGHDPTVFYETGTDSIGEESNGYTYGNDRLTDYWFDIGDFDLLLGYSWVKVYKGGVPGADLASKTQQTMT